MSGGCAAQSSIRAACLLQRHDQLLRRDVAPIHASSERAVGRAREKAYVRPEEETFSRKKEGEALTNRKKDEPRKQGARVKLQRQERTARRGAGVHGAAVLHPVCIRSLALRSVELQQRHDRDKGESTAVAAARRPPPPRAGTKFARIRTYTRASLSLIVTPAAVQAVYLLDGGIPVSAKRQQSRVRVPACGHELAQQGRVEVTLCCERGGVISLSSCTFQR